MTPAHVPFTVMIPLGSPSADAATIAGAYFHALRKCKITKAALVNGATLAASDTDFTIVNLKNGTDIVAEIDTRAAHEDGLTEHVGKAMNIDSTKNEVAAGSTLTVQYNETDSGTAVALTSAVLALQGYWIETAD